MTFVLGTGSRKELVGVHPYLIGVVELAITLTVVDFSVHDGVRTHAEQVHYVQTGVSKTMASQHLPHSDGLGHAVDLVPYINGKLRWEWPPIYQIAVAMRVASERKGVPLRWGGIWAPLADVAPTAADMKAAVDRYVASRRKAGKSAFIDGPHFELLAP